MTATPDVVPPTEVRMAEIVFPNHTNHMGTLFGGQALAWMDKAAFLAAARYSRRTVVTGPLPTSKIYKAYNFLQGVQSEERKSTKAFAVKVVSTGTRARAVNLAKPLVMIKHELHMLKLFNKLEANKPVAEQSVVKLFSGGVVVDKSPMIVAHKSLPFHLNLKREFSMIYVMEFGDSTLDKHLMEWDVLLGGKWSEGPEGAKQYMPLVNEQIKRDAEHLLLNLANTLMNFHKYAVHLHLKPGNWVFVRGEDKWKLIDLQSAIPNFEQSNAKSLQAQEERFPEDFVEFACNSLSNEIFLTKFIARANEWPSTYASPEHISACKRAHSPGINRRPDQTKMVAQLMQIGPKSDVWSFGVLMLEMLAHTPQKIFVKDPKKRAELRQVVAIFKAAGKD
uniref:Protein kinase domain-containing protein n=1 Tax=Globodera pallida TaxID=36090 RepID=A0A183CMP2_GLOPA